MKSIILTPYCPFPATQGSSVEMMKHINILHSLGECTIASAGTRPVGMGWKQEIRRKIEEKGIKVVLREEFCRRRSLSQWLGMAYAVFCKGLKIERAFGHANPYHRTAFQKEWWREKCSHADLAVINYSYWSRLPTDCPKVIVLHDLLSNNMWGGRKLEFQELQTADLIVVISKDEEEQLRQRGLTNIIWSPPLVAPGFFDLRPHVGIVGSANRFNREGLRWLNLSLAPEALDVRIYGALADMAARQLKRIQGVASYIDPYRPYRECGIILIPTAQGTGVQIKVVEALACGRAIIARRGAMRGLPKEEGAWIEVDSPTEMWAAAKRLTDNKEECENLAIRSRAYYMRHLDHEMISTRLREIYSSLGAKKLSRG